jgi:branched-chain amino acid transport system ATP-binding protein
MSEPVFSVRGLARHLSVGAVVNRLEALVNPEPGMRPPADQPPAKGEDELLLLVLGLAKRLSTRAIVKQLDALVNSESGAGPLPDQRPARSEDGGGPLLSVCGLAKRFGGLVVTDDVNLGIVPGEIHALIGPNGAGKTTLIGQLSGEVRHDAGDIRLAGEAIGALPTAARVKRGLARTFQISQVLQDYTAFDNVLLAVQARRGHSFRFFMDPHGDPALYRKAMEHIEAVGLGERALARVGSLSHGERKQLELAIALATEPRVLLVDEPMAGLGPAESARMVELLRSLKGRLSILLVEHDMEAVAALADRVSVLVYGRIVASGTFAAIRDDPRVREAYLGDGEA